MSRSHASAGVDPFVWPSPQRDRNQLLNFLLDHLSLFAAASGESSPGPPIVVRYPAGVSSLEELDLDTVDVQSVLLQVHSLMGPRTSSGAGGRGAGGATTYTTDAQGRMQRVLDLSSARKAHRLLEGEGDTGTGIFVQGWRDHKTNVAFPKGLPVRVVPPPLGSGPAGSVKPTSSGAITGSSVPAKVGAEGGGGGGAMGENLDVRELTGIASVPAPAGVAPATAQASSAGGPDSGGAFSTRDPSMVASFREEQEVSTSSAVQLRVRELEQALADVEVIDDDVHLKVAEKEGSRHHHHKHHEDSEHHHKHHHHHRDPHGEAVQQAEHQQRSHNKEESSAAKKSSTCSEAKPSGALQLPEAVFIEPRRIIDPAQYLGGLDTEPGGSDRLNKLIYDQVLLCVSLFLSVDRSVLAGEVLDVLRPALGISAAQHTEAIAALAHSLEEVLVVTTGPAASGTTQHLVPQSHVATQVAHSKADISALNCSVFAPNLATLHAISQLDPTRQTAALVQRMQDLKSCLPSLANRTRGNYPLPLRALFYAGFQAPLFHVEDVCASDSDDLQYLLPLARKCFVISEPLATCCRVHSIILRYRSLREAAAENAPSPAPGTVTMSRDGSGTAEAEDEEIRAKRDEEDNHYIQSLATALQELKDESEFIDPEEKQYRHYVLQQVFSIVTPPLVRFDRVADSTLFTSYCELFVEVCQCCSLAFLTKSLCHRFDVSQATDTEQVTMFLISHMLCAPLYEEFAQCSEQMTADVPLNKLIELTTGLYESVQPYGELWSSVVPHSCGLIAAGLIRMYNYVLKVHWAPWIEKLPGRRVGTGDEEYDLLEDEDDDDVPMPPPPTAAAGEGDDDQPMGGRAQVEAGGLVGAYLLPEGFHDTMDTIYRLVVAVVKPHLASPFVMANCHAAMEDLAWIKDKLLQRQLKAVDRELSKLVEAMLMNSCWFSATLGQGAHSSSIDIFAMFYQMFGPIPSYIVPHSVDLVQQYIEMTLKHLETFLIRVVGPFDFSSKLGAMDAEAHRLGYDGYLKMRAIAMFKLQKAQPLLTCVSLAEVLLRLNTLIATRENLYRYFEKMYQKANGKPVKNSEESDNGGGVAEDDESLRSALALTGGAPLDTRPLQRRYRTLLDRHITDICEFLALRVLYNKGEGDDGLVAAALHDRLYKLDLKFYKQNKGNKKLLAEDPYAHMVFAHPDLTVTKVLNLVDTAMMGFMPFIVSVSGRERAVVQVFFHFLVAYFNVLVDGGENRFYYAKQGDDFFHDLCYIENFFLSALSPPPGIGRQLLDESPAPMILTGLKCILSLVMTRSTEELIDGSDMSPPYDALPEQSTASPFTKWVVKRVLAHRKDSAAKKFAAAHPVQ